MWCPVVDLNSLGSSNQAHHLAKPEMLSMAPKQLTKPLAPHRDAVDRIGTPHSSDTFGLLDTKQPIRVGSMVGPKAHVLVCAPSNSALDEIVARLLQHGVLDWCAQKGLCALLPPLRTSDGSHPTQARSQASQHQLRLDALS